MEREASGDIKRRLIEENRGLAEVIGTSATPAELAILAVAIPEALDMWGLATATLRARFREGVRERYRALARPGTPDGARGHAA